MEQKLKQRIYIEYFVKRQISATETYEMLNKAFPNDAPKRTTDAQIFKGLTKMGKKIPDLIKENPQTTLLELKQDTSISKTTIGRIVTEYLKLKKTPEKFIPRFLTNEKKLCRLATCEDMLEITRTDPEWKDKIITGDETWVYGYDPETKRQSAEWRGQAHLVTRFLAKTGTQILPQPPYSPDIAPNDFFLFPKLKAVLKGRHFDTRDDIIEKSPLALKSIPKEAYKNCFDNWEKRWRWCVETDSPSKADQMPGRHGLETQPCAEISAKFHFQNKFSTNLIETETYANLPAGKQDANSATSIDFATKTLPNGAIQAQRNWADSIEDVNPEIEDGFTVVQGKNRRRGSAKSCTFLQRQRHQNQSPTAIVDGASSTEKQCIYIEHCPEIQPYHYLKAIDKVVGGASSIIQITRMNGHFLMGLANKSLAERLINQGLEVEGMLLKTFPFRKRSVKITIGNLPFFVGDASVIDALSPYGRVTSIAPKQLKADEYVYTDGRREAFIVLHDGMNIERLPTRLDLSIKGEACPAFLTFGIRCSRCYNQGHRRADCPLLAGQSTGPRQASPTSPTDVPSSNAPELPDSHRPNLLRQRLLIQLWRSPALFPRPELRPIDLLRLGHLHQHPQLHLWRCRLLHQRPLLHLGRHPA
ncbi:hypothetical protein LAZ67_X002780 [Cordylochernes scorpioides]|uniref:CCHC-type domain-containing protein n=1 Tax=Cordylochernes scorpioides TaxID=51811 RepID=A0ABY6LWW1_9ARAC|nr:hypothetical protein LAZ67_X002780 [Cordylochernes scorpioides]